HTSEAITLHSEATQHTNEAIALHSEATRHTNEAIARHSEATQHMNEAITLHIEATRRTSERSTTRKRPHQIIFINHPVEPIHFYFPSCNIVSAMRPRFTSTSSTQTVTTSPTETTSIGCLTKRLANFEMWTNPSCPTPISTKAPKYTTFLTVPSISIPCSKSSNDNTFCFKIGCGKSSRKSRPGRLKAPMISRKVMTPTSNFSAISSTSTVASASRKASVP